MKLNKLCIILVNKINNMKTVKNLNLILIMLLNYFLKKINYNHMYIYYKCLVILKMLSKLLLKLI